RRGEQSNHRPIPGGSNLAGPLVGCGATGCVNRGVSGKRVLGADGADRILAHGPPRHDQGADNREAITLVLPGFLFKASEGSRILWTGEKVRAGSAHAPLLRHTMRS